MIDRAGSDTFLRRIEDRSNFVKTVDTEFAVCLATLGKHFRKYHEVRYFASPINRVSNIIRDLILNENDLNKRFEIIKKSINNCTNILLVVEILYHFKKENNPNSKVLNDKDYQELEKLIAGKIKEDAKKNGMFYKRNDLEKKAPELLTQWKLGASKEEVSDYILNQIGNSPSEAIQFLKSFMTTRYEGDETIRYFQFKADHYKIIRELVNVDTLYKILFKDFEKEMKDPQHINIQDYENGFNKGLAKKFAYLHKKYKVNN